MSDDTTVYLLLGVLIGLPVGAILYKLLFQNTSLTSSSVYGGQYTYDDAGHLTSYTPVPLPGGS